MITANPTDLATFGVALLDGAGAVLDDANITGYARRIFTVGELAHDQGDTLGVVFKRLVMGQPGREQFTSPWHGSPEGAMRFAEFTVEVATEITVDQPGPISGYHPPSIDDLGSDAASLLTVGWALFYGLSLKASQGTLTDSSDNVLVGPMEAPAPQGGFAALITTVRLQV